MDPGEINFRENKSLLFTQHRELFYVCVLTAFLDAVSTVFFMYFLGPDPESNVIVRQMSYFYGIYLGPVLGKVYQLFGLWGLSVIAPRLIRLLCAIIIAINLFAFAMNMITAINA
jgi:hypothetical protein